MSTYVDGFVIPVPKDKIEQYREMSQKASAVWKEYGALEYYECVGDDMEIENMVPFPKIADAGPDDVVVFAWIMYRSREHRDEVNSKVIADPRMNEMMDCSNPPFDCKKMAYGGFKVIVKG
ncbi:MAG: DUF1428 domain-containing protein [Verrucomicrobiaceae bacterium]|nr:MAG: DUF1428 domain-containing protein [Verrucomicrobiaceae bacterium]